MAAATRWRGIGIICWRVVAEDSKGNGGGGDGGSSQYPSLLFFSNYCGQSFHLASVELYSRNSNKGNIAILSSSQGIYPPSSGISQAKGSIN
jgi:hypothetical protein